MKLSEHIARMQVLLAQRGNLDLACTTGGKTIDPDVEAMEEIHIQVVEVKDGNFPLGVKAPYVLIGGEGREY